MNDQFNEQKEILSSLKHEISLLQQQIDYLIRNERALGLLDLDVLMNRTHTIYDRLCSINIGSSSPDNEEVDIDPTMINALFGLDDDHSEKETIEDEDETEVTEEATEDTKPEEVPVPKEELEIDLGLEEEPEIDLGLEKEPEIDLGLEEEPEIDLGLEEEPETETEPETVSEPEPEPEIKPEIEVEPEPEVELEAEMKPESKAEPESEKDFGFIFKMEPLENNVYTTGDEIEMVIPHFDFPASNDENEEEPVAENDTEEETLEEETLEEETRFQEDVFPKQEEVFPAEEQPTETNEDFQYEPIIFGNMEEAEEVGFEMETPETLGEKMQHEEDHSVAAMLQHQSIRSLKSAIGINDKFLLVNELFSGSMEKYNRSIENLDDVKTLNGALIYLNELRIDLQWNSNNEAYKKLLDLVHRKFES